MTQQVTKGENINYMIFIGLLNDLSKEERDALQAFNKAQEDLVVVTWDWVLENIGRIEREIPHKLT